MTLEIVSEVIWRFYQQGRTSATNQKLRQNDMFQLVQMAFGDVLRKRWYEAPPEERMDLIGGSLEAKEFELGEPRFDGSRRLDIPEEVVRMPKAADITNVIPVSENNECGGVEIAEATQVSPGEENFYKGVEFSSFLFYVQKGRGINTYNFPPCIKKVSVERIYASKQLDVPLDMAYDIAITVLGISLRIEGYIPTSDNSMNANKDQLRAQLEAQNGKI